MLTMLLTPAILILTLAAGGGDAACTNANWWYSFEAAGLSMCDNNNDFITGFYRHDRTSWTDDYLYRLEEATCCFVTWPWTHSKTQVVMADWWSTFDRANTWASCPSGYFLNGLYTSNPAKALTGKLTNIEEGRCVKPADHPAYYGQCYDHDISICFDNVGYCRCNDNYFVTGLYRTCDQLHCLEKFRCCKMVTAPEELDELYKVKTRVMDNTMADVAMLAHYLGYGWCSGCRAPYVGEDFRRSGDTWYADQSGRCEGYMSNHRLSMVYGDWSFGMKDIKFGAPTIQELEPETIDSGTIYNNDPKEATKTITRSETSVRSVTHTKTSGWKHSHELNVQVSYTPASGTGGAGVSAGYKFNYESSTSTTDETKKEQSKTFSVSTSKTLGPNSAAKWSLILSKTRTSVTYTATIVPIFSTELKGFLRWGGGASGIGTNYHYQYRGSGDRPTFNYKFGDSSTPFYTALRRQSETNSQPWLWNDMTNSYPEARDLINELCDDRRYAFTITGRFDDVIGKHAEFRWDAVRLARRSAENEKNAPDDDEIFQTSKHVARPLPGDIPPVSLEPPKINIAVKNETNVKILVPAGA
ncbi:aerolysin-like [Physella acuta]|uniref:aerolysin-like n=1 Tax=Physella acuta TaxID=109671 RepID=UPI0027DB3C29|nr:aerolysin-like [Physella acuta]